MIGPDSGPKKIVAKAFNFPATRLSSGQDMHADEFNEKVFALKDRMFRFALSILGSREDAEDVLQETLARLWTMRAELPAYNSIEALTITMIRNASVNKLKSRERKWVDAVMLSTKRPTQPDEVFERNESLGVMLKLIHHLPPQQRSIVLMRDIEGKELGEIAALNNMSLNNVRVTLSLGRKKIIELYTSWYGYERK